MGFWQAVVNDQVVAEASTVAEVLKKAEDLGYTRSQIRIRYQREPGEIRI